MMSIAVALCAVRSAASAGASAGEWQNLFNGEDLTGWTQMGGDRDHRGRVHVADGAIVGTYVAGSANTLLATERTYGDFVLDFEFMIGEGINSGVQFRSRVGPACLRVPVRDRSVPAGLERWRVSRVRSRMAVSGRVQPRRQVGVSCGRLELRSRRVRRHVDPDVDQRHARRPRDRRPCRARICIRNVDGSARTDARYRTTFALIDADRWILFDDPAHLELRE